MYKQSRLHDFFNYPSQPGSIDGKKLVKMATQIKGELSTKITNGGYSIGASYALELGNVIFNDDNYLLQVLHYKLSEEIAAIEAILKESTTPAPADKQELGMDQEKLCSCGNEAEEPHICPYQNEINDDDETLCTCCKDCQGNCRDDI